MAQTFTKVPQLQKDMPWHRPLVPVLAGFIAGIWLDEAARPGFLLWSLVGCAALGAALLAVLRRIRPWANWSLALLLLVPAGGAWHLARARHKPPWYLGRVLTERGRLCGVRGTVTKEPELHRMSDPWRPATLTDKEFWIVRLDTEAVAFDGRHWARSSGGLAVFAFGDRPEVRVGDDVEFLAFVRANRSATNPGEVDMREVRERWGTAGTASVYSPRAFHVLHRAHWWSSVPAAVGALRTRIKQTLIWDSPSPASGLAVSLVLGERSLLSDDTLELMCETGTVQFIAISGLHVWLFAAFLWAALICLRVPVRGRSAVLIGCIWVYILLTGWQVSAQRAGWVFTFLVAAPLLHRRHDAVSAMAGAALVILALRPQELFSVGFQFTFVAVWAIVYLYGNLATILWPWDMLVERLQQPSARTLGDDLSFYGRHYLLLSVCVWIALAPLQAHYFHTFCIYTPLVNVVLWPLMLILIVGSFLLLPAALIGGLASRILVCFTGFMSAQCEALLRAIGGLPGCVAYTAGPPGWWMAISEMTLRSSATPAMFRPLMNRQ